jgi:hypothetical protein
MGMEALLMAWVSLEKVWEDVEGKAVFWHGLEVT